MRVSEIAKFKRLYFKNILQIEIKKTVAKKPYTNTCRNKDRGGVYIGHSGRVISNSKAVLGRNINIATGVTIGVESRGKRKGCLTIGDNCWIGTNAVIVGNITIGTDVLIAPLSFVNFDVPDHSIVIGNPAKIVSRENATEGYVNNKV